MAALRTGPTTATSKAIKPRFKVSRPRPGPRGRAHVRRCRVGAHRALPGTLAVRASGLWQVYREFGMPITSLLRYDAARYLREQIAKDLPRPQSTKFPRVSQWNRRLTADLIRGAQDTIRNLHILATLFIDMEGRLLGTGWDKERTWWDAYGNRYDWAVALAANVWEEHIRAGRPPTTIRLLTVLYNCGFRRLLHRGTRLRLWHSAVFWSFTAWGDHVTAEFMAQTKDELESEIRVLEGERRKPTGEDAKELDIQLEGRRKALARVERDLAKRDISDDWWTSGYTWYLFQEWLQARGVRNPEPWVWRMADAGLIAIPKQLIRSA